MKNFIKSALFLIICCFITACGPSTRDSLITKTTSIPQADKTMVIFSNHNNELWVRLDDNYGKKDELLYRFRGTFSKGIFNSYHIHMLEPGTYALEHLITSFGGLGVEFEHLGKNRLVTFVAKPGEIIYVGDIKFYADTKGLFSGFTLEAKLEDKFDDAKAYLTRERPDINPNLLKKELVTIKPELLKKR